MKFSCACTTGLALVFAVACSGAAALDAPHTLHHSRATQPHLSETHHAATHHAAIHTSTGAHAATASSAPARLTPRGQARATARQAALHRTRHHYYERFTASSFATSAEFAGDLTAGEDPVVRRAIAHLRINRKCARGRASRLGRGPPQGSRACLVPNFSDRPRRRSSAL